MSELVPNELERCPELASKDLGAGIEDMLIRHVLEEIVNQPKAEVGRTGKRSDTGFCFESGRPTVTRNGVFHYERGRRRRAADDHRQFLDVSVNEVRRDTAKERQCRRGAR
ncbi:hypothetical protein [Dactylosporangium sp. NPDC050588]|uniref:hypothetical protein n=1 Tax=Dactylosporangium sp. NPDC050588 TaxID=3157211 RepID=UPI0033C6A9F1